LASGNVNAGAVRVFLEDTGEGVLLGVFDGRKVLAVRELPPLPVDKVAVEMRRSSRGMDRSFSAEVFSNDPDLGVVAASVFGDGQKKPVILGIGLLSIRICRSARFGIHFMLPEEIIRHKKAAYFKREVLFFLMFGVLVVLASGLCFAAAMQRKERLSQETVVQRELVSARERLDIRRKQVCSDRIRRMPFVGSADVFEQLLSLIPSGYKVERVRWVAQEEGNGNVDAVIVEQGSSGLNEHWLPEGWKARRFISRGQPMTGLQFHLENGPVLFTQRRNK
jgi:hypothetical protein